MIKRISIFALLLITMIYSVFAIQEPARSWTFNTDANDGYNIENGTLIGNASIISSSLFGGTGYLSLDGTNDYVKLRWNDSSQITNGSFSARTWFIKDNSTSEDTLMSYLRVADGNNEGYRIWLTNTGKIQVNLWNGTTGAQAYNNSNSSIKNTTIYLVHFVFDMDTSIARIYINGTLDNEWHTNGIAPSFGKRMCHSIGAGFYFGTSPCSQREKDTQGKIWNSAEWFGYALTSGEVAEDFANLYQFPFSSDYLDISLISPADNTISNQKLNISYSINSSTATANCSLYINASANLTSIDVANATISNFYVTDMNDDATYSYFIACQNNATSAQSATYSYQYSREINPQLELPLNATHQNTPLNVFFNVTGNANSYSCGLYVNSVLNKTNSNVLNATTTNLTVTDMEDDAIYTYYIGCTQNNKTIYSSLKTYVFDSSQPLINMVSPLYDNSTSYSGYTSSIIGNTTDEYLFRVNISIYNGSGALMYSNYSGDLVATTTYNLARSFNTTLWANGFYRLFIESADSHTGEKFEVVDSIKEFPEESKYKIELAQDAPEFVVGNGLAMDFVQKKDRISFIMTADKVERKSFTLKTEEPLVEIVGSEYPCHYVFGKYWFDCEGLDKPTATMLNSHELYVEFDVVESAETPSGDIIEKIIIGEGKIEAGGESIVVGMKSLGGLNENTADITFNLNNCVPSWVCSDYNDCLANNTQTCNIVSDTSVCGLPYEDDMTEFTQACDYCEPVIITATGIPPVCYTNQVETYCIQNISGYVANRTFEYVNYASCCADTSLVEDCNISVIYPFVYIEAWNGSTGWQYDECTCTGQTWNIYNANDLAPAAIDGVGKLAITFVAFAGLIGLVIVGAWAVKTGKFRGWFK